MPPEKSPRQPRKPFRATSRKDARSTPRPGKARPERSDSRKEKPYAPKGREDKPFAPKRREDKTFAPKRREDRSFTPKKREEKPFQGGYKKARPYPSAEREERPVRKVARKSRDGEESGEERKTYKRAVKPGGSFTSKDRGERPYSSAGRKPRSQAGGMKYPSRKGVRFKPNSEKDGIRLNKYIANAGICSRREADQMIQAGVISINGVVVTELGSKVMPGDKVQYGDQTLSNEKKRYLLLNKQKGYVTTTKDPHAKNTVMELIEGACKERIYPVGRLDRNTTGLLLFTNDGEMAKKLMHPSSRVKKMYHVVVDQPVKKADLVKIAGGISLDDTKVLVDGIAYVEDAKDRREIGIELHSGQNRVVRRIFESLGYKVTRLDRVMFAGLTKKGIPRGKWRFLNEQEIIRLMMIR